MFCYQCEQTVKGTGCTKIGVCGKDETTSAMQDALVYVAKGVSMWATRARALGEKNSLVDRVVIESLFTTVTNVSFDAEKIEKQVVAGLKCISQAKKLYVDACAKANKKPEALTGPATLSEDLSHGDILACAAKQQLDARIAQNGPDIIGLEELITYGLKGMAAYADHALVLGRSDEAVNAFFHEALDFLTRSNTVPDLTGMALKVGEINLKVMALLDEANTGTYGHPVPTNVPITVKKGKAILVSGHDLKDLETLLIQTQGKNINVYTHGEMLPCHAYPGLKKYPHLVGNYGGAWQDQAKEFDAFPGSIVMTTNCIQKPKDSYTKRLFTTGLVAFPGVAHVPNDDFSKAITSALEAPGFPADEAEKTIMVGFGHNAVLGVADKVIDAVKSGAIKHFFLIGGCDGAKSGRNYYTEFATEVPKDCVILTLACGKYRFNKLEFGDIGGIPRLLDIGQCNDAYSAIQIAVALAGAFNTTVNQLPLSMILSWYEQKAVCILLTLLHLGIKDIRIGPSLPAFVTAPVLNVLVENFAIKPIGTAKEDLKAILG